MGNLGRKELFLRLFDSGEGGLHRLVSMSVLLDFWEDHDTSEIFN